jgi:hypothetical protein
MSLRSLYILDSPGEIEQNLLARGHRFLTISSISQVLVRLSLTGHSMVGGAVV